MKCRHSEELKLVETNIAFPVLTWGKYGVRYLLWAWKSPLTAVLEWPLQQLGIFRKMWEMTRQYLSQGRNAVSGVLVFTKYGLNSPFQRVPTCDLLSCTVKYAVLFQHLCWINSVFYCVYAQPSLQYLYQPTVSYPTYGRTQKKHDQCWNLAADNRTDSK